MREIKGYVFVKKMGRFSKRTPYSNLVIFGDVPINSEHEEDTLWMPFKSTLVPFSEKLDKDELSELYREFIRSEGNDHSLGKLEMQVQTNEEHDIVAFQRENSFILLVGNYLNQGQYGLLGKPKNDGVPSPIVPFDEGITFENYDEVLPFYLEARNKYGERASLSTFNLTRINPRTFEREEIRI